MHAKHNTRDKPSHKEQRLERMFLDVLTHNLVNLLAALCIFDEEEEAAHVLCHLLGGSAMGENLSARSSGGDKEFGGGFNVDSVHETDLALRIDSIVDGFAAFALGDGSFGIGVSFGLFEEGCFVLGHGRELLRFAVSTPAAGHGEGAVWRERREELEIVTERGEDKIGENPEKRDQKKLESGSL